jgi:hypothetical protein
VQEVVNRNESLPAEAVAKITTMAGCSAVKNNIRFKTLDSKVLNFSNRIK